MDGTVLLPPFPSHPCCCRVNVTWVLSATHPWDYGGVPRLGEGCLLGQGASPRRCCTETLSAFSRSGMEGKLPGWVWRSQGFQPGGCRTRGIPWWGREVGSLC